jgi:hypothetical protein
MLGRKEIVYRAGHEKSWSNQRDRSWGANAYAYANAHANAQSAPHDSKVGPGPLPRLSSGLWNTPGVLIKNPRVGGINPTPRGG